MHISLVEFCQFKQLGLKVKFDKPIVKIPGCAPQSHLWNKGSDEIINGTDRMRRKEAEHLLNVKQVSLHGVFIQLGCTWSSNSKTEIRRILSFLFLCVTDLSPLLRQIGRRMSKNANNYSARNDTEIADKQPVIVEHFYKHVNRPVSQGENSSFPWKLPHLS